MREIINQSRRTIAERKRNGCDFRREIGNIGRVRTIFQLIPTALPVVADIVPELPPHTYRLRSHGPVSSPIKNLGRI